MNNTFSNIPPCVVCFTLSQCFHSAFHIYYYMAAFHNNPKFTVGKCKMMHIRTKSPNFKYILMGYELGETDTVRDLRIVVAQMTFGQIK